MTAQHDAAAARPAADGETRCITCGDLAEPLRVVHYDAADELALCEGADGTRCSVETALVGALRAGDVLLVHAGTAIARAEAVAVSGPPSEAAA